MRISRPLIDEMISHAREEAPNECCGVIADDGWKYLSSGIYTLPVDEIENLDSTVWW